MGVGSVSSDVSTRAVLAGAAAGLVVGTAGLFLGLGSSSVPVWSAMLGAAAGGAVAAYLSSRGLGADVLAACLADLLSSAIVFVLGVVGFVAALVLDEGLGAVGALFLGPVSALFGLFVAIPVALASVAVAAVVGAAVSVLFTGRPRTTFTPRDRGK